MGIHADLDLSPEQQQILQEILERHLPNREVRAFGSRVRGTAREQSDLDLCIMGDASLPLDELAKLQEAFDDSDLPFHVDIVDWVSTSDSFRRIIRTHWVVVRTPGQK